MQTNVVLLPSELQQEVDTPHGESILDASLVECALLPYFVGFVAGVLSAVNEDMLSARLLRDGLFSLDLPLGRRVQEGRCADWTGLKPYAEEMSEHLAGVNRPCSSTSADCD
jgi:hypothetical protein